MLKKSRFSLESITFHYVLHGIEYIQYYDCGFLLLDFKQKRQIISIRSVSELSIIYLMSTYIHIKITELTD